MNSQTNDNRDDLLRDAMHRAYEGDKVPHRVQVKLEETYARLSTTPQIRITSVSRETSDFASGANRQKSPKPTLRKIPIVAAALVVALILCGATAYAVSRLVEMGSNEASYFEGNSLPIYDSLRAGTASLSADVGESQTVGDFTVTFDTVSTDRNIVNLFFTIEQEGGFDLDSLSIYDGSHEGEWARLQRLVPFFGFSLESDGSLLDEGTTRSLDAYLEDGKIRCMMRIVPGVTLPDHVDLSLSDLSFALMATDDSADVDSAAIDSVEPLAFSVGLDLSAVAEPQELGAQELVFQTDEGAKKLSIERFTVSDFGTVFVAKNYSEYSEDGMRYGVPDDAIDPYLLKMADGQGNVLNVVEAGDGLGHSESDDFVLELSGLRTTEGGITFTPMAVNEGPDADSREASKQEIDVTQIGSKLPISEYGGYELIDRTVEGSTISITLRPYGWLMSGYMFELIPLDEASMLWTDSADPETGETYRGGHSAIRYTKSDFMTGDHIQIDSYYAASEEDLQDVRRYAYHAMFGVYTEESDAAQTVSFQE